LIGEVSTFVNIGSTGFTSSIFSSSFSTLVLFSILSSYLEIAAAKASISNSFSTIGTTSS